MFQRSCIRFFNKLPNHRWIDGKKLFKSTEIYVKNRPFLTDSSSQKPIRLAYDLYSPPANREKKLPPVILLHAVLDSRKTWRFIAPEIAKRTGRKVYTLDSRNHGESPWSDEFTFDLVMEDLDAFLTQHNIHKATLVGHSMGGRTSLAFSLKKPNKVEKLVVEDMHTRNFRPTQGGPIMEYLQNLKNVAQYIPIDANKTEEKKGVLRIIKPFLESDLSKLAQVVDINTLPFNKTNGSYYCHVNLKTVEKFMTTNDIFQNIHGVFLGDALFIYGTKSFFKVDTDPHILEHFPRAVKVPIEGATHFIHIEDPGKFMDKVINFINGYSDMK